MTLDPRFSPEAEQSAYDEVAADYTMAFADDLARLPLDRAMLDAAIERLYDAESRLRLLSAWNITTSRFTRRDPSALSRVRWTESTQVAKVGRTATGDRRV